MDRNLYIDDILGHTAQFLPNIRETTHVGSFNAHDSYWSLETHAFKHRPQGWIWVSGTVPENMGLAPPDSTGLVLRRSEEQRHHQVAAHWGQ